MPKGGRHTLNHGLALPDEFAGFDYARGVANDLSLSTLLQLGQAIVGLGQTFLPGREFGQFPVEVVRLLGTGEIGGRLEHKEFGSDDGSK